MLVEWQPCRDAGGLRLYDTQPIKSFRFLCHIRLMLPTNYVQQMAHTISSWQFPKTAYPYDLDTPLVCLVIRFGTLKRWQKAVMDVDCVVCMLCAEV